MDRITKFQLIKDNLYTAKQLIDKNKSLQSFFLMFPIFEVIGDNIFNNDSNNISKEFSFFKKEIFKGSAGKFTIGYWEIFYGNFMNLDLLTQGISFYKISRCGLYHSLNMKEDGKPNSLVNELTKLGKNLYDDVLLSDSDNKPINYNKQFIIGSKYTYNKLFEYLSKIENSLTDKKYKGLNDIAFNIENINSESVSGTNIANIVHVS